jgi:hypothetical protein
MIYLEPKIIWHVISEDGYDDYVLYEDDLEKTIQFYKDAGTAFTIKEIIKEQD